MKSDKALFAAALELTQRIQLHFPREISPKTLGLWNSLSAENLHYHLLQLFGVPPADPNDPLHNLGEIDVPASLTHNIAGYFGLLTHENTLYRAGGEFSRNFLREGVDSQVAVTLSCFELKNQLTDIHLVDMLGGESSIISHPSAMTHLMRMADKSKNELLDLGNAAQRNVFLFKGLSGSIYAVFLGMFDSGWTVDAVPLYRCSWFSAGTRIFVPKKTA